MTIFVSDLMKNGAIIGRPAYEGEPLTMSGTVKIPAGTDLATTDKILLARFPEGTVFDQILIEFPDLDDGSALALNVGYNRPVVDPSKAYDATTNPYTDNAIATADEDFFEAAATTGQAGGVLNLLAAGFTVTSSPVSAGDVDVSITPSTGAGTASTAGGMIKFFIKGFATDQMRDQASESYGYSTDYDIT